MWAGLFFEPHYIEANKFCLPANLTLLSKKGYIDNL